MNVLLTGGTGFLGKYVQEELSKCGINYALYLRNEFGSLCSPFGLSNFLYDNEESNNTPFDSIIHLAATVGGIGFNKNNPYRLISENLQMGLNVIDAALEWEIPKIVMTGTVCSYPELPKIIPFIEEDIWDSRPEPTNSGYGIAKRTLTEVLWTAYQEKGLKSIVLNLANLYGEGDSQDLENNHVIPAIISKLKTAKTTGIPAKLWGNGHVSRDFLHASDAAKAIVKSLALEQGPREGINVGTQKETYIFNLVDYMRELLDLPTNMVEWDKDKPSGQRRRCVDITKAKKLLGWEPTVDLAKEIERMVLL